MRRTRAAFIVGVVALGVLATLNAGGYRYGAADQAFYLPAVEHAIDPSLFPHDRALLGAQDRLELFDEAMAATHGVTGLSLPWLFAVAYGAGLLLLFAAVTLIGRRLYVSWWATAALGLALTLRHRIARTGVNTLEGYLHPRMLAFALGLAALAAFLRGRDWLAFGLVAAAGVLHPTIAAWFALWLIVALAVAEPRRRPVLAAAVVAAGLVGAWAVASGPLHGRLARMDPAWLAVLGSKDYLFPTAWPWDAWLVNLAYPVVIVFVYRTRRAHGLTGARETGLTIGSLVLLAAFLVTLPFVAARLALAVQLQISRMFWMLDFWATVYLVWALADRPVTRPAAGRAIVVGVLAVASFGRGLYVTYVEGGRRPWGPSFATLDAPASSWSDVMRWLRNTPAGSNVLADPGHAWRYGTSVRAAACRDVYLEEVKDAAIALYSRDVAMRVADRTQALGDFAMLTAERARSLAARYDLDYLVTTRALDLPLEFQAAPFHVYGLRTPGARRMSSVEYRIRRTTDSRRTRGQREGG
jgi:hypothetical protein